MKWHLKDHVLYCQKKETMYIVQWLIEAFDTFYWRNYDKWKAVIVKHDDLRCLLIRKGLSKLDDVNQLYATFMMMFNMSGDVFKIIN